MSNTNNASTVAAPTETGTPEKDDTGVNQQPIDLQALAEKVFALMQQEMRIERERMGRSN